LQGWQSGSRGKSACLAKNEALNSTLEPHTHTKDKKAFANKKGRHHAEKKYTSRQKNHTCKKR
jgi:hypothetical protein